MKLPFLAEGEAFWLAHFSRPECVVSTPVIQNRRMVSYVYESVQDAFDGSPSAVVYDINLPFEECRA